jgi:copper oxidase (laccase) domain-containing protein
MLPRPNVECFPALASVPGLTHAFTLREPGLDVRTDRESALARLESTHATARHELGVGSVAFVTGKQVHGAEVATVTSANAAVQPVADGLITNDPSVCLGVYVADCCPVFIVDPRRRAIGLLHSGRKGSELGIARVAVEKMQREFGSHAEDLIVQLGPCIRACHYEVDFAARIVASCREAGVRQIHDPGTCTACHPEKYYSYRRELGQTGRMVALLALT